MQNNGKWSNVQNMQLYILNINSHCYETNFYITYSYVFNDYLKTYKLLEVPNHIDNY